MKKLSTRSFVLLVLLALLVAILIVLGYVNIPQPAGLSITFNMIPVAIAAIVTSGSKYRQYRRENPEVVAEWNKDIDEGAPLLGRIIHYEAYRMMYDLNRLTEQGKKDHQN